VAYAVTRLGSTCGEAMEMPRFHVEGPEAVWISSEDLIGNLQADYGQKYQLEFAEKIAGPVAGITRNAVRGTVLAASEHGPGCVSLA